MNMANRRAKHNFIRFIRLYPFIAVALLLTIYLLGGFDAKNTPIIPRPLLTGLLYVLVAVVPVIISAIFIGMGLSEDRARSRNLKKVESLSDKDPFTLDHVNMSGFKVVALTGEAPTFTGITGNTYSSDESAICTQHPEHVPPESNCECGFYCFKKRSDAEFELSIHPGLFLIDVDLFGLGFEHKYGFRAESQRVNSLSLPRRCMRCKTFPARIFVKSFKIGYWNNAGWQWSIRCLFCSRPVKENQKKTIIQMSEDLQIRMS